MPLTPSHAVVALAVRTRWLPASAVAIGAMAPDLPLFVPWPVAYGETHDLANLAVPVAIAGACWVVWRYVVAPAARDLAPAPLALRLPPLRRGVGRRGSHGQRWRDRMSDVVGLMAALAIGVVSHIAWDAFTHAGRWGVELVPALSASYGGQPGYSILQDVSGVVGLTVIAVWAVRRPPDHALDGVARHRSRLPRAVATFGLAASALVAGAVGMAQGGGTGAMLFVVVTTGGLLGLGVLLAAAGSWWLLCSDAPQDRNHPAEDLGVRAVDR